MNKLRRVESIAAIDIGSNAIRLLINNVEDFEESKALKKNAYIRVPVRLGEDVFSFGIISEDKIKRFVETMRAFVHLMHVFNVRLYRACATSAMREAENGLEVADRIYRETGLQIDVISGGEEAEIVFQAGFLDEFMDPDKHYLHVDVGGGSTEIIVYFNHQKQTAFSYPIGTLRILAGAVSEEADDKFKKRLKKVAEEYGPFEVIASGGNINKTLKLLGKKDGDSVSYGSLKDFHKELSSLSFEERLEKYKMNSYRADVIVPALYIFLTVGKVCKVKNYIIPKVGLVDGIIRQLYGGHVEPKVLEV
ncbi:hypothetical protein C4J81_08675 [Deltaproteobacteria bacterium Smac51]|nr:hypothetical protein C4J81_08675 [Deltaproteobacteria bacterium Smac51]